MLPPHSVQICYEMTAGGLATVRTSAPTRSGYDLSLPCPLTQNRMTTVRRRSAEEHHVLFGLQVVIIGREESVERSAWRHTEAKRNPEKVKLNVSRLCPQVVVGFPTRITEPTLRLGSY